MFCYSHADHLAINTINRCVRTRLYFTSESHLHSLFNVLKYPKDKDHCAFCPEGLEILNTTRELSYLTQVVIRVFSDKADSNKFRCEIYFTPGATNDPLTEGKSPSLAPYVLLNKSISYDELCTCLDAAVLAGSERPGDNSMDHNDTTSPDTMKVSKKNIITDSGTEITRLRSGSAPTHVSPIRKSSTLLTINANYSDNHWELDMSPSLANNSNKTLSAPNSKSSLIEKSSSTGTSPQVNATRKVSPTKNEPCKTSPAKLSMQKKYTYET